MPRQVTLRGKTYTEAELDCPECGRFMVLDLRPKGGLYYRCSSKSWTNCPGTHSCHQSSAKPLGIPGDAPTKAARMQAHKAFDQLWKKMGMKRKDAYRWLQTIMDLNADEAHIGRFTVDQCELLLDLLDEHHDIALPPDLVEADEGFVEFGFNDR
jgi:hypothetical protein